MEHTWEQQHIKFMDHVQKWSKMPSKDAAALRNDGGGNFIGACDHGLADKK